MQRIAPSQRVGEALAGLLTGGAPEQLSPTELRGLLVRLGMQRVLQELLEAEQRDFLGAERYQRGPQRQGQRNGYEPAHLETAEGRIELHAPQVRGSAQPFQSRLLGYLQGRTETVERLVSEMYAHGLSTRDIEEERRRTKTIPHFFNEKGGLKLCYAALLRASQRWQRVTISEFDRTRLKVLREQVHQEYLARRGRTAPSSVEAKAREAATVA